MTPILAAAAYFTLVGLFCYFVVYRPGNDVSLKIAIRRHHDAHPTYTPACRVCAAIYDASRRP